MQLQQELQQQEQERLQQELQQVFGHKQLMQVLIMQLIEQNVSFLYPLRYELKLNQLRRTTFSPTEWQHFTSNNKKFQYFLDF